MTFNGKIIVKQCFFSPSNFFVPVKNHKKVSVKLDEVPVTKKRKVPVKFGKSARKTNFAKKRQKSARKVEKVPVTKTPKMCP